MCGDKEMRQIALQVSIALAAGMFSIVPVVHGAPVESANASTTATIKHGVITNANGTVTKTDASYTSINSTTQNNVIDWQDFSVAKGETVQFDGGNKTNNYMNIVSGANTSTINGAIKGGNDVFIINPNGIIFGKGSSVDVGSLYATTRADTVKTVTGSTTVDYNATKNAIITAGSSTTGAAMDIVNMGNISATDVVLEGENIRLLNSADINATNKVTLRADDGYIHVGSTDGTGGTQSAAAGLKYTSEALTSTGSAKTVEGYKLVFSDDSTVDYNNRTIAAGNKWSDIFGKVDSNNNPVNVTGNYMLAEDIKGNVSGFKTVSFFEGTTVNNAIVESKIDGNFYAVKDISNGSGGLFTNVSNATIMNMGIKDSTISKTTSSIGALADTAKNTTFINVYNDNTKVTGNNYTGGLIGQATGVTILSSYNTGDVNVGSSGNSTGGGGLVGYFAGGTNTVNKSYSTGSAFGGFFYGAAAGSTVNFDEVYAVGSKSHANVGNNVTKTITNSVSYNSSQYTINDGTSVTYSSNNVFKRLDFYSGGNQLSWSTTDITNTGGLKYSGTKIIRPTWRIYEGKAAPILTSFTQGIKTNTYDYKYYKYDTSTSAYVDDSANTLSYNNYNNGGKDMTAYTYTEVTPATTPATYVDDGLVYNGRTLKIVDSSGNPLTSVDTSALFATQGKSTIDASHVQFDSSGRKDATSYNSTTKKSGNIALIYSDQNGYDLVGNNIAIAPRLVTISNNFSGKRIVKEYDGSYDAENYVSSLFSGSSVSSTGLLQEDINNKTVGVEFDSSKAKSAVFTTSSTTTAPDENVGANKSVLITGDLIISDGQGNGTAYSGPNYVLVDNQGNPATSVSLSNVRVDATIYQHALTVNFTGNPITKEYDKNGTVKEKNFSGAYVTRSFGTGDFTITNDTLATSEGVALANGTISTSGYEDSTGKYNVGTYNVTFNGVNLNSAGANYVLKDAKGNVVYSANPIITATQTGQGTYNISTTAAVTSGTLKTTGAITLRQLSNTGYKWYYEKTSGTTSTPQDATKEYDHDYAFNVPSDITDMATDSNGKNKWYVTNSGSSTGSLLPGDSIELQIDSAKFWTTNGTTTGTQTRDAGTASGVQYHVTVTGNSVGNYTLDGTTALTNGGTADVYGAGSITPRTIFLVNGIAADKVYDGDADVYDNPSSATRSKTFDLSTNYLQYDSSKGTAHQLISGDTASIEITGAYKITGTEARAQDVNYGVNASTSVAGALPKDIEYTATIKNDNGNYVFAVDNGNGNITSLGTSTKYAGSGTIEQVQLGSLTFADVSKTFDGTATVNASDITLNTPTGLLSNETINDVFYVDSAGKLDATGQTKLTGQYVDYVNGAVVPYQGQVGNPNATPNTAAHATGATWQDSSGNYKQYVQYVGAEDLMKNHNYKLASTQSNTVYGEGTINRYLIDDRSKINLDLDNTKFITKEYDGDATITNYNSYLNSNNATITGLPSGSGLSLTVKGAEFSSEHSNSNSKQNIYYYVKPDETGNYGIGDGTNGSQNIKETSGTHIGEVKLTLSNAGIITQKHITADSTMLADSNLTKPYDSYDNVLKTGDNLIDITSQIRFADRTDVTNAITANYVTNAAGTTGDVNASLTSQGQDKFVKYTLSINDAKNNNDYFITANSGDKYSVDASGNVSKINDAGNGNITSVTNWTTDFTVANNGTINKRVLGINFDPVQKTYDGGANVTNKTQADTISPHITNAIAGDKVTLNIVGIGGATTGVTATYVDPTSLKDDPNYGPKTVKYINLNNALTSTDPNKAALISRNYEFANNGVAYGTGQIDKATISMNDLRLYVGNITKTYNGSADFTNFAGTFGEYGYVDLGNGVNNPRFTYTINGAEYVSKGTGTSLAGAGTGKDVVYHLANITLGSNNYQWSTGGGPIASYDFSSSASNSSSNAINIYTGTNLTTPGTGAVTKKDVYAKINTPFVTKTYNADTDVLINGAAPANIDTLVTINGLVNTATNTSTNTSTVNYTNQDKGTNKDVDYNLSISDGENYNILYDSTDANAVKYTMGYVGNTNVINKVTTHNNEIKAKDLYVTFDKVTKTYDGTTDVPTNSALGAGKYVNPNFNGGLEGSDELTVTVGNGTAYNSPNVPDASYITYKNIVVTGANGTNENNYNIIWQNRDGTTGSASAVTGDGQIDKLVLTTAPNITRTSNPVTKEYAGVSNANIAYNDDEDLVKVKNGYLQSAQVTINGQQQQIPFDLTAATYDNNDGSITGGTPRGVTFTVELNSANINFSQVSTNGQFTINDTGTITPRKLYVSVDPTISISKVYDGNTSVLPNVNGILRIDNKNKIVSGEDVDIDNTALTLNAHYNKKDTDASKVIYTTKLTGTTAGNYEVHDANKLNTANDNVVTDVEGNGEITKRQVTINLLNGTVDDKPYDGSADATKAPNYTNAGRFSLETATPNSTTGILSTETTIIKLDNAVTATYDHGGHVQRDPAGMPIADTVTFGNFGLTSTDNTNYPVSNYTLTTKTLQGSGKITPRQVAVDIAAAPTKTYDGKTDVGVTDLGVDNKKNLNVITNVWGTDSVNVKVNSADFIDSNGNLNGHVNPAGPKGYVYKLSLENTDSNNVAHQDYELVYGGTSGNNRTFNTTDYGLTASIEGHDGTITPRPLTINSISPANKPYDGMDVVVNAGQYINIDRTNVVGNDDVGLSGVTGTYLPVTIGTTSYAGSDAGTAETDSRDSLVPHDVVYTLTLSNPDYVLVAGSNNPATGTISRKGLDIVATPVSVNANDAMPVFTGKVTGFENNEENTLYPSIADGRGLEWAVANGTTTSNPGQYAVYGWYTDVATGKTAGNLGLNYYYKQAPANDTAFTVNIVNNTDNPDTKITPTPDIYHKISKDMNSGFGDNDIAAIEYRDKKGTVIGTVTIDSGEVHSGGTKSGTALNDLSTDNTNLGKIGIAGGDIVNMEGADAASNANIAVSGDGTTVNLEVQSITNEMRNVLDENSEAKIEKSEKEGKISIKSSDGQENDEIELTIEKEGVNVA